MNKSFGDFGKVADLPKTEQAASEHATDFDIPIYNIWKQQTKWTMEASVDGSKMHQNQHDCQHALDAFKRRKAMRVCAC